MKKWIIAGALALALSGSVASGYALRSSEEGAHATPSSLRTATPPDRPDKPAPREQVPAPSEGGPPRRVVEKIERVEVGMAYTEVLAIMGPADWEEEQSTDFGDDVILWYSGFAVYVSNKTVTTIDYYE
jgi:hypothetical protein